MAARTAPIGVFDSGIGGLTVLHALREHLPNEDYLYLGDTARLPYGTKTPECVRAYAVNAVDELLARGVKCVVVACNTASAHALAALRERCAGVPVVGVIEPGAHAAAAAAAGRSITVLATEGTVRAGAYAEALRHAGHSGGVSQTACALFVALAEEGWLDGPVVRGAIERYIGGSPSEGPLLLGCTHFPPLRAAIAEFVGPGVPIVDSATTTADAVARVLEERGLVADATGGAVRCLVTDGPERFSRLASVFCPGLDTRPPEVVTLAPGATAS